MSRKRKGNINLDLFEDVFGDGTLEIDVEERHYMDNLSVVHLDRKKDQDKKKCRKFKKNREEW